MDLYETNETCPHCDHENIYNFTFDEIDKMIAICQNCGKKIFLCNSCPHLNATPSSCNWHENADGSHECYCGKIEKGE